MERQLLDITVDAVASRPMPSGSCAFVRVVQPDSEQIPLAVVERLDGHPSDFLFGYVAPDAWLAIGLSTNASVARDGKALEKVQLTAAVTRAGHALEVLQFADSRVERPPAPAVGVVPDMLRRVLGLATNAPETPVGELVGSLWLCFALAEWPNPTWPQLQAALEVVENTTRLRPTEAWEDLRWRVVTGDVRALGLSPVQAAWLDAGSFSRWTTDRHPRLSTAFRHLQSKVPTSTVECVRSQLHRWGTAPEPVAAPDAA
jgi:hypothetical protein